MSLQIKYTGIWIGINQIWIKHLDTWTAVRQGFIKDGGVWKQFFSSAVGVISNSGVAQATGLFPTGVATANVSFNSDGSLTRNQLAGWDDSSFGSTAWLATIAPGNGAPYWLRATIVSGTLTSGVTGIWQSLSSTRAFTKSLNSGFGQCVISVDFATDAAGTTIVSAGNSWTLRCTHAEP